MIFAVFPTRRHRGHQGHEVFWQEPKPSFLRALGAFVLNNVSGRSVSVADLPSPQLTKPGALCVLRGPGAFVLEKCARMLGLDCGSVLIAATRNPERFVYP